MTLIINIFGAPGAGKSTHRAKIFAEMKIAGYNVEEITEYAKDAVWEERHNLFSDQLYILAKQHRKLLRLVGKVDFIISDSPLLLNIAYSQKIDVAHTHTLIQLTSELFNSYDNLNILLNRTHSYQSLGRNQTEAEADVLSCDIKKLLDFYDVMYSEYGSAEFGFNKLVNQVDAYKEMLKTREAVYNVHHRRFG